MKYYRCEICERLYDNEKNALDCEAVSAREGKGVKVGDIVMITGGEGAGKKATVTYTGIFDQFWGHCSAKRYHHTVYINADIIDGYGSRLLTFDDYRVLEDSEK